MMRSKEFNSSNFNNSDTDSVFCFTKFVNVSFDVVDSKMIPSNEYSDID